LGKEISMKEKYVGPAYGLGNWRKIDTFTRTVYDFSGRKSWTDKAIGFVIWGSAFITLSALAAGFLWLFGG
jgi:hypothetical protein